MRRNRAAEAAMQAVLQGIVDARNMGHDYFKIAPDLMLVEVARYAATKLNDKNHQIAFLQGYSQARSNHDAWQEDE